MQDIASKCTSYELPWFVHRYNALIVDFPDDMPHNILANDALYANYDAYEVYNALKSAHKFLVSLSHISLNKNNVTMEQIKKVFTKIDLIWGLNFYGQLCEIGNEYCLEFNKAALKTNKKTLPSNYGISFNNIIENGCYVEYFKNDKPVNNYKTCDRGILHFDDSLTALGIYLFTKKVSQKRWYWDEDTSGNYAKKLEFNPVVHCIEPFYRVDMRIFNCGERLKFNYYEHLSGYNEIITGYFKTIYEFIEKSYPQCLPEQGFFKYISCSVTFKMNNDNRMLGQVGVGGNEQNLGFYTGLAGKEMELFLKRVDEFEPKILNGSLVGINEEVSNNKHNKKIIYRGQPYNFLNTKAKEFRFSITSETDVEQVIKLMEIKAMCKRNTI